MRLPVAVMVKAVATAWLPPLVPLMARHATPEGVLPGPRLLRKAPFHELLQTLLHQQLQ